nr:MAG TPA: hypothetical protein [Caudoviricetes sp.]
MTNLSGVSAHNRRSDFCRSRFNQSRLNSIFIPNEK